MPQYDYISFMDGLMGGDPAQQEDEVSALADIPNGSNPHRAPGSPKKGLSFL